MDQRRFEQTFRHIVTRLNGLTGDAKALPEVRPIAAAQERKEDRSAARRRQRGDET